MLTVGGIAVRALAAFFFLTAVYGLVRTLSEATPAIVEDYGGPLGYWGIRLGTMAIFLGLGFFTWRMSAYMVKKRRSQD